VKRKQEGDTEEHLKIRGNEMAGVPAIYSRGYVEYVFDFYAYKGTLLMPSRKYADKSVSNMFARILGKVVSRQFTKNRMEICGAIALRSNNQKEIFAVIVDGWNITAINVSSVREADELIDSILELVGDSIDQDTKDN
jgi:hypothetical protein